MDRIRIRMCIGLCFQGRQRRIDIAFAEKLYLTLVPPDYQPQAVGAVNDQSLFQGGLTPYGP